MELTREQAITEHRNMWNWIADSIEEARLRLNVFELKKLYCERSGCYGVIHYCFLCEYTGWNCKKCPLEWKSEAYCMCEDKEFSGDEKGLWRRCYKEKYWRKQAELAREIANLTERKDV